MVHTHTHTKKKKLTKKKKVICLKNILYLSGNVAKTISRAITRENIRNMC